MACRPGPRRVGSSDGCERRRGAMSRRCVPVERADESQRPLRGLRPRLGGAGAGLGEGAGATLPPQFKRIRARWVSARTDVVDAPCQVLRGLPADLRERSGFVGTCELTGRMGVSTWKHPGSRLSSRDRASPVRTPVSNSGRKRGLSRLCMAERPGRKRSTSGRCQATRSAGKAPDLFERQHGTEWQAALSVR